MVSLLSLRLQSLTERAHRSNIVTGGAVIVTPGRLPTEGCQSR